MNIISRTKKIPEGARWLCVADLHLHHLPSWRLDWCYDFADDLMAYLDETSLDLVLLGHERKTVSLGPLTEFLGLAGLALNPTV